MYLIKAFEGSRGTSHRIRPVYNCVVKDASYKETSYGWEGEEVASPKDPLGECIFWDIHDSTKSYSDLVILLPNKDVWEWRREENRWAFTSKGRYQAPYCKPIPKGVIEIKNKVLAGDFVKKDCKFLSDSAHLRCAVHPLLNSCEGCEDATFN